jgi:hypothetical protein
VSFTRFVLPFGFSLVGWEGTVPSRHYHQTGRVDQWRRSYFTSETANVLFDRARWLVLTGGDGGDIDAAQFKVYRGGRPIDVVVSPPRVVLFEARRGRAPDIDDPMRTGFLILDASFLDSGEGVSLDDLLDFNEMFRYWRRPFDDHDRESRNGIDYASFLAECPAALMAFTHWSPTLGAADPLYIDRWACFLDAPVLMDGERYRLFPTEWTTAAREWAESGEGDRGWIVYDDHRAFVWTCALVEGGWLTIRERYHESTSRPHDCGHWTKLLNVDRADVTPLATSRRTSFEGAWTRQRTYRRWEESGTLYGFNYHCGAMLAPAPRSGENALPIWKHFATMYFDQTLLLLYLRVATFRFSRSLSLYSPMVEGDEAEVAHWRHFRKLRQAFAVFTNLYQFPLLSNQQQGIEMYVRTRRWLDIDEMYREVKEEIEGTHEFLEMQTGQALTTSATRLAAVATLGVAPALAIGFLGMNVIVAPLKKLLAVILTNLGLRDATAPLLHSNVIKELFADIPVFLVVLGVFFLSVWLISRVADRLVRWLTVRPAESLHRGPSARRRAED